MKIDFHDNKLKQEEVSFIIPYMETDIRWKQRFENYKKAFCNFESAINLSKQR